ncbi:MAG TPA: DinB family protein [Chitinophagaceae bacterium]|nr:DinB family protein [Chitinophagaceae bacterium]
MDKLQFLKSEYIQLLNQLDENTPPLFGKMNVQQMIEHVTYSFRQAAGELDNKTLHDETTTQKMYQFLMSDKPFKENTPNPLMPDIPAPAEHACTKDSLIELNIAINHFVEKFQNNSELRIINPFFGNLNFTEWVQLLHKHTLHHLKQFGVNIATYQ